MAQFPRTFTMPMGCHCTRTCSYAVNNWLCVSNWVYRLNSCTSRNTNLQ